MFKKFYLPLVALLLGSTAMAQDDDLSLYGILVDQPLITSADQLVSAYSDEAEGLHIEYLTDGDINTFWHSDWHGRVSGTPSLDIALTEETEGYVALYIGRRNSSGTCQFTNMELQASPDGKAWTSCGTAVMEYLSQNEYVPSIPFYLPQGTKHVRMLCVGRSNTVGVINDCGIGTFHMGELQLYRVDDTFGKEYDLTEMLLNYDEFIGGASRLNMGEGYGQYTDYEAEQRFVDGLTLMSEILASGTIDQYSNAQVRDILAAVNQAYADVLASEVAYQLPADGYYRIHCDTYYYADAETGEIDLDGNPVVERTEMPKAFYATLESKIRWGDVDNTDCRFVWHLERQADNSIVMLNAATGERVADMSGSGAVVMSAESDTTVMFDYATTRDDRVVFCIRFKGQPKDMSGSSYKYFHQWFHNDGAGTGGEVCYWQPTYQLTSGGRGTSEYYLEPVPEAEAQALIDEYAVIKDRSKMLSAYVEMIENAKVALTTAKAGAYSALTDQPLITDAAQFHSLWSDPDEGKSFEPLLDKEATTFWHSTWHGSSYDFPFHSIDVELPEGEHSGVMAWIQRRQGAGDDHITRMEVYGTNDAALLQAPEIDGWAEVAREVLTPWNKDVTEHYTSVISLPQSYKYLRFLVSNTGGNNTDLGYRTFFHMAGFQLYPVLKSGNCQYDYMAAEGDKLQEYVDMSYSYDYVNDLTLEYFNGLKAAYDAFVPNVIDVTPLSDAISRRRTDSEVVELGEHPGFWPDEHATNYLAETIAGAEKYLSGAYYTPESMQEWIDRVNQAGDNILKSVIPISTDKWYRIRFGTAEEFEAHNWSTSSASTSDGSVNVFGMVFAPGRYVEATELTSGHTEIIPHEDIREGVNLSFINPDMLDNDAYAIWRFVNMGNGKYAIQQKYTSLYIQRDRYHGESIHLDVMPTEMDVKPQGYGQVAFVMQDLAGFSWEKNFINTWRDHYQLISWNSAGAGTNSAFYIEEVGDIDPDEEAGFFYRDVTPGSISALCYPMSVTIGGGTMYSVAGTYEDDGTQYIALSQIEEAEAAQPFIYIAEGEYDAEAKVAVPMSLGRFIERNPKEENGLKAHFTPQFIDPGYVLFAGDKAVARNGQNVNVVSNEAYLTYGAKPLTLDDDFDLAIAIDGTIADGIRPVLNKLAKSTAVYDLNGRQVMAKGTISDVRRLAPGTYIVGGVKICVK